jgi:hypothetical protein
MRPVTADCELRDDWFLGQDVNAWTSLAYLGVGLVIVSVVLRRRLPPAFLALGAVAAVEGIGSLLYHGGEGELARLLHDVPLVGALGFVAGWHVGRLLDRTGAGALVGLVAGLAAGAVASTFGGTNVAVASFVIVIVAAALAARRRHLPAVWNVPLLALVAVAGAVWLAGTSGSPLCDEQSWAQPHGLWHLLSALMLLAWAFAAAAADGRA